jgi:hypothetical protein
VRRGALLAGVLAVTLAGCIGGYAPEELTRPEPAPGAPRATLAVSREGQVLGVGTIYSVLVDGRPVADLKAGQRATVEVPPGTRIIGLECAGTGFPGSAASLTLPAEAGKTYEVETFSRMSSPCSIRLKAIVEGSPPAG